MSKKPRVIKNSEATMATIRDVVVVWIDVQRAGEENVKKYEDKKRSTRKERERKKM